jgi:pimeloyl-ACP methyl ester carboxylesterase
MNNNKLKYIVSMLLVTSLIGCGSDSNDEAEKEPVTSDREWWATDMPDYSENPDRPVIELTGSKVIHLGVNDTYIEYGATAIDAQDGDLTEEIIVGGMVITEQVGDYLIRYQVADSDGNNAIIQTRIVRVIDEEPKTYSKRPIGSSASHLGYFERLPDDFGQDDSRKYPLVIFNHGAGANTVFSDRDPSTALDLIIQHGGPVTLLDRNKWDKTLPFILLAPQLTDPGRYDPIERIDVFIEYAKMTYNVDPDNIFMTGWSQGGFVSFHYAAKHPEKLSAIAPIAGGFWYKEAWPLEDTNYEYCDIGSVPIWAFHGDQDPTVSAQNSIEAVQTINSTCNPTETAKLTIFNDTDHFIHRYVYNSQFLGLGDPDYDIYTENVFNWFESKIE